jgi:hypothetical protein
LGAAPGPAAPRASPTSCLPSPAHHLKNTPPPHPTPPHPTRPTPHPPRYDNLVMEESAQILEIETFIPMVLQAAQVGGGGLGWGGAAGVGWGGVGWGGVGWGGVAGGEAFIRMVLQAAQVLGLVDSWDGSCSGVVRRRP